MGKPEPTIWPYLLENNPDAGVIIVCRAGLYTKVAHESEPIACTSTIGFHCFILITAAPLPLPPCCWTQARRAHGALQGRKPWHQGRQKSP
jgi:hypothetical protein